MTVQAETMQSDLNNQWENLQLGVPFKNFCQNKNYLYCQLQICREIKNTANTLIKNMRNTES